MTQVCQQHHHQLGKTFERSSISFCIECLWELTKDLKSEEVSTDLLIEWMHVHYWKEGTPQFIFGEKNEEGEEEEGHYTRILKADLTYPIIILREKPRHKGFEDERTDLLDGIHRLSKAILHLELPTIRVKYCDESILSRILRNMNK